MSDFEQDVAGISTLADPGRRALYRYVCERPGPVSRDEAAAALGIPRHQAKFHLDRLEAEGLLVAEYARLTGRTGPGAGRPAKLYRRADREIAVSLPDRQYELAGRIMADAITESLHGTTSISEALRDTALAHGRAIATSVPEPDEDKDQDKDVLDRTMEVLAKHGYEPRREGDHVIMANCPFHSLAQSYTELVCEMNHSLITGITETIAPDRICACLEPAENRCCVILREN